MVPSERPPFMPSPPTGSDGGADAGTPPSRLSTKPAHGNQTRNSENSDSDESLKRHDTAESATTIPQTSSTDAAASHRNVDPLRPHGQDHPSGQNGHEEVPPRGDTDRTTPRPIYGQQTEHTSQSDSDTNVTIVPDRIAAKEGKGEHSPPLTGKDSAYSSMSGGSFASPTGVQPRSASSQSSYPRAQFGLFPSSGPSTPKHSISGRHGAMSPALTSPRPIEERAYTPVQRSQTSLDNHPTSASRGRLLKKSSLSSLKRLFSKKKHGSVDTIAE